MYAYETVSEDLRLKVNDLPWSAGFMLKKYHSIMFLSTLRWELKLLIVFAYMLLTYI